MAIRNGEFNISMTPTRIQGLLMVLLCQTVGFIYDWLFSWVENGCLISWGPTQTCQHLTEEKRKFSPFGLLLRVRNTFLDSFQHNFPTSRWLEQVICHLKNHSLRREMGVTTIGSVRLTEICPKSCHGGVVTQA